MDIVHHAFIGGIGYMGFASNQHELAGMAFVAGSVLPDLDVAFMAFGKRAYLRNHQGLTHSLLLAPLFAFLFIALPMSFHLGFDYVVFLAALAGIWTHSLLDYSNTFGITLFWPLSRKRFCIDALFFIDSIAWLLTLTTYIAYFYNNENVFIYYAIALIVYALFKHQLQLRVKQHLNSELAIPSALNPFDFYILLEKDNSITTYRYNTITTKQNDLHHYSNDQQQYSHLVKKSDVYKDMKELTRYFFITSVNSIDGNTEITIKDLGIRNFGGKFAETRLVFSDKGELISEMANI